MGTDVFISGGTGYIGARLIPRLLTEGHRVRALARPGSLGKVVKGCDLVPGDALKASTFAHEVASHDTFIHMVGVPKPSPLKAEQFRTIDLVSLKASVTAAAAARVRHFIYISVAHPAPVMKAYIEVRTACEGIVRESGLDATFVRPWYVLGPGHRWPHALQPLYALAERIPSWREGARRLGLVTLDQMVEALAWSVSHPSSGVRVLGVPEIRDPRLRSVPEARQAAS